MVLQLGFARFHPDDFGEMTSPKVFCRWGFGEMNRNIHANPSPNYISQKKHHRFKSRIASESGTV